jgi:hypothetical protein
MVSFGEWLTVDAGLVTHLPGLIRSFFKDSSPWKIEESLFEGRRDELDFSDIFGEDTLLSMHPAATAHCLTESNLIMHYLGIRVTKI